MEATSLSQPPSRLESELRRIRELLERRQFAAAFSAAQVLLQASPENRDVLYLTAVSQRYLGRIQDALATLVVLERHHPNYAWLHQERGHCHVGLRAAGPAAKAFARAVALNSTLTGSWNALQLLYRMSGRSADAEHAATQVANLAGLPQDIVTAFSMYADGQIQDAEHVVRQYLLKHGDHVEGMRLLAQIGVKMDVLDDAECLLESLLTIARRLPRRLLPRACRAWHKHLCDRVNSSTSRSPRPSLEDCRKAFRPDRRGLAERSDP